MLKLENSRIQDPTFQFPNSKKIGGDDNLKNVDQSFSMEDSDEQNSSNSDTKSITASYVNESGASGLENEGFVLQNNSKDN